MVLLQRTLVEPKQADTSVVNRAKLVVSMPGWLMRVCAHTRRRQCQADKHLHLRCPCLKSSAFHKPLLHCFCFTGTFMYFLSFRRCFVAIMLWLGCAFNPVALLTITPLKDQLNQLQLPLRKHFSFVVNVALSFVMELTLFSSTLNIPFACLLFCSFMPF